MPRPTSSFSSSERSLKSKVLPGADADARKSGANFLFVLLRRERTAARNRDTRRNSSSRAPCRFLESRPRRGSRRRLLQIGRKRLHLVAGLNLFDVLHVGRVEQLGAISRERELRARPEHLLDAGRRRALPVGPDHHVVAGVTARRAAADVAVIVGVAVAELDRIVALRIDGRDRKHRSARRAGRSTRTNRAYRCSA